MLDNSGSYTLLSAKRSLISPGHSWHPHDVCALHAPQQWMRREDSVQVQAETGPANQQAVYLQRPRSALQLQYWAGDIQCPVVD